MVNSEDSFGRNSQIYLSCPRYLLIHISLSVAESFTNFTITLYGIKWLYSVLFILYYYIFISPYLCFYIFFNSTPCIEENRRLF